MLSLFSVFNQAFSNPIDHIYESFKMEPAAFLFNSLIIVILLAVGGILAGITQIN